MPVQVAGAESCFAIILFYFEFLDFLGYEIMLLIIINSQPISAVIDAVYMVRRGIELL